VDGGDILVTIGNGFQQREESITKMKFKKEELEWLIMMCKKAKFLKQTLKPQMHVLVDETNLDHVCSILDKLEAMREQNGR
jgi:hypothetical protein